MFSDISPRQMLEHETTNKVSHIHATIEQAKYGAESVETYLSDDAPDDAVNEFLDSYNAVRDAYDEDPIDEQLIDQLDETAEYFDDELYEEAKEVAQLASCLNAYLEQYKGIADDDHITLEELTEPMTKDGGSTTYVDTEPTDYVEANEGLRLLTSTIRKNWHEHGQPEDERDPVLHTTITRDGDHYQLDIWDNGPGMNEDSFEDALETQPKAGMGLFMAGHLAELYDSDFSYLNDDEIDEHTAKHIDDPGTGLRLSVPAYENDV